MLVRTEGILTQLVFEHSLRIRLKAEVLNDKNEEDNVTVVGTPDSASVAGVPGTRASEASQASTAVSLDSSNNSQSPPEVRKDKDDPLTIKSDAKQAGKGKKGAQNLVGKINNLVTTDLGNIVDARDFLVISTLQIFFILN